MIVRYRKDSWKNNQFQAASVYLDNEASPSGPVTGCGSPQNAIPAKQVIRHHRKRRGG